MINVTLRLTDQQYRLLEAYRIHLAHETGEIVSKQEILYNALLPILQEAQEATE